MTQVGPEPLSIIDFNELQGTIETKDRELTLKVEQIQQLQVHVCVMYVL